MNQSNEAVCDSCRKLFLSQAKKHFCSRCNRYYWICGSCSDEGATCPECGLKLAKKAEAMPEQRRAADFSHRSRWNLG